MSVEKLIERKLLRRKHLLFVLLDAEVPVNLEDTIRKIESCDIDALLVGGSTIADQMMLDETIKRLKEITSIPVGYIIIGTGQAAGFVGRARSFPEDKPELVASYALAAYYLGMRYVYLEAGSGAKEPISPKIIRSVRKIYPGKLIVGGGIRSQKIASKLISEGADILVIGNLIYEQNFDIVLKDISKEIHKDG